VPAIIVGKKKPDILITVPYRFIQSHRDRNMFRQPNWGKKYYLNLDTGEKELVVPTEGQRSSKNGRPIHVVFRRVDTIHELPPPRKPGRKLPKPMSRVKTKNSYKKEVKEEEEMEFEPSDFDEQDDE